MSEKLKPCPFCGGAVDLEEASSTRDHIHGVRRWWGVICRNTENLGGSCAIWQNPSASKEAAIERWNRRAPESASQPGGGEAEVQGALKVMAALQEAAAKHRAKFGTPLFSARDVDPEVYDIARGILARAGHISVQGAAPSAGNGGAD